MNSCISCNNQFVSYEYVLYTYGLIMDERIIGMLLIIYELNYFSVCKLGIFYG